MGTSRAFLERKTEELKEHVRQNFNLIYSIVVNALTDLVTKSRNNFLEKGYCGKFIIDYNGKIKKIMGLVGIDEDDAAQLAIELFNIPKGAFNVKGSMYGDPYYIVNLLLLKTLIDLARETSDPIQKQKYETLAKAVLFLILAKLWNGRLTKYIRYCDPNVMNCVLEKLSNSALVKKYPSPLELLSNYFVTTLYNKYVKEYEKTGNIVYLEKLFKQAWNRIDQIFRTSRRGENKEAKGISVLYYQIKRSGECSVSKHKEDADVDFIQLQSEHEKLVELVEQIKNFILFSHEIEIPEHVVRFIIRQSGVSRNTLNKIIGEIQNPELEHLLADALNIFIRKLNVHKDREFVCSEIFLIKAAKLISSKNNPEIEEYKRILSEIARYIVPDFDTKSNPTKISILKAINAILAYLVQEYICKHHTGE